MHVSDPDNPGEPMPESIEMIADDPHAPSFGGGATRVLSEHELDGLIEATVSPSDVGHPRAPKQTKRIEALARIEPSAPGNAATESPVATEAVEAALLDAAYSGASIVVDPSATIPSEPERPVAPSHSKWRRIAWRVLIVLAALAGAAAARMLLRRH